MPSLLLAVVGNKWVNEHKIVIFHGDSWGIQPLTRIKRDLPTMKGGTIVGRNSIAHWIQTPVFEGVWI